MRFGALFALVRATVALVVLLISGGAGHRRLQIPGLPRSMARVPHAGASSATEVISVKAFGARGDGLADDHDAILRAVAALPARGGILFFPCGTYVTRSSSALVTLTDRSGTTIEGSGSPCTTLQQAGPGNGIELIGKTETTNIVVRDLALDGSNRASKGIDTQNL